MQALEEKVIMRIVRTDSVSRAAHRLTSSATETQLESWQFSFQGKGSPKVKILSLSDCQKASQLATATDKRQEYSIHVQSLFFLEQTRVEKFALLVLRWVY